MPPRIDGKKRRNKRKSRTDVSSPSSSDSEEPKQQQQQNASEKDSDSETAAPDISERVDVDQPRKTARDFEKAFEDFYLRQATKEFANDLDKLRSAGDFNDKSVPLLVDALKQGTACFSKEERVRVGESIAA